MDIQWNIAWAQGISRGLKLYFIVYPDLSHNTDILNYNSSIFLPGDQYWKIWFSVFAPTAGQYRKIFPSRLSNTGELNINIILFSTWQRSIQTGPRTSLCSLSGLCLPIRPPSQDPDCLCQGGSSYWSGGRVLHRNGTPFPGLKNP